MRNSNLLELRNAKIFSRYNDMYWGQLMRDEEIYKILEAEFYLGRTSLYLIVLKQGKEEAKRQHLQKEAV